MTGRYITCVGVRYYERWVNLYLSSDRLRYLGSARATLMSFVEPVDNLRRRFLGRADPLPTARLGTRRFWYAPPTREESLRIEDGNRPPRRNRAGKPPRWPALRLRTWQGAY